MDLACNIALDATTMVSVEQDGRREIDIKRYAKVEKVSSHDPKFPGFASTEWSQCVRCKTEGSHPLPRLLLKS